VVACSRRWGKSVEALHEILYEALVLQHKTWWLSPTYAQGDNPFNELVNAVSGLKSVEVAINRSKRTIRFSTGGLIEFKTANKPDNLRGAGVDFVVLDEAAFMPVEVWSEVVRPMLVTTQGRALFLSTPFGGNWFQQLYARGLDPTEPEWSKHHFTIYDAPHIPASEIESLQRESTERVWSQEFLAEFLSDTGAVFRGVDAVMTLPNERKYKHYDPRSEYVFGVDWGREHDYTAIAVFNTTKQHIVHVERFREIGWSLQRGRLVELFNQWRPHAIWAESNSIGSPNIEALQTEGLPVRPFATTHRSKGPLIESLALAIESQTIQLVQDDVLRMELTTYAMDKLPGGGYKYSAPAGGHDDTVIATALAWHGGKRNESSYFILDEV
jgi:phage FluMu gp28-like protein